ncbi:MAG: DegT/DnrJ/EryC1/StrS family aminotransferase, partial [Verrucomicrobiales bacterium]|nr:DegT/DnrJ/EryC1/StrS family aminotransferase [Verrucomicrobiales bacterium]
MRAFFPAFPQADLDRHRREIDEAICRTLASGRFILSEEVSAFEEEFAKYLGVPHVVALGSGTDAVEIMLRAHDIGTGAQVVLPSHAPSAIASAVRRSGADILLADVDPATMTLCPNSLASVLSMPTSKRARAVVAVHLYGHPVAWDALQKVATEFGVLLLEDAAQAHGAEWSGQKIGSLGKAAAFSFYPTKNLAAMGDAGALATSDGALAERVRELREYGWRQRYISANNGVNSRMDELQAAILRVKLRG